MKFFRAETIRMKHASTPVMHFTFEYLTELIKKVLVKPVRRESVDITKRPTLTPAIF